MTTNPIPLETGGVYLFRAPAKISAQVNRDLVAVFSAPSLKAAGAFLYSVETHLSELQTLLDMIIQKLADSYGAQPDSVQLKLFGLSATNRVVSQFVHKWARENRVTIVGDDTGRNVTRNLMIDCETGRVGVSYAEGATLQSGVLVDMGSMSRRRSADEDSQQALVLCVGKVHRQLCQQSIAEVRGWKAVAPEKPYDILTDVSLTEFPWATVILFDDVGTGKPVKKWVETLAKLHPGVKAFWVGKQTPSFADGMGRLAPIKPSEIQKFKKALRDELTALATTPPPLGQILPFR